MQISDEKLLLELIDTVRGFGTDEEYARQKAAVLARMQHAALSLPVQPVATWAGDNDILPVGAAVSVLATDLMDPSLRKAGHSMVLIAITKANSALLLVIDRDGEPVGVTSYGLHAIEERAPIAFVPGIEAMNLTMEALP